ncbi:MAG: hypothetical protein HY516_04290 [Candidatus Aenigmarchaeota archaeon]|nr:hypothetical protein [Candidatus Aenigmarchaeota archaeon]
MVRTNRKGISPLIAGVIYTGLTVAVVTLVITLGLPQLDRITESTLYLNVREGMTNLDDAIQKVASEGRGSVRIVPLEIRNGDFTVDGANDVVKYEIETTSEIVSPRTAVQFGNLVIGSNADVNASENATHYTLQNSRLQVTLRKFGSPSSQTSVNTTELVQEIKVLSTNKTLPLAANGTIMQFVVNGDAASSSGTGFTTLHEAGTVLSQGNVSVYVNAASGPYTMDLILESEADYLTVLVKS